ncbi:MAG: non-homologous end-joining DNA ligase [Solirubrobacteraceae bacterium]
MGDRLGRYRAKRDFAATPEPPPGEGDVAGEQATARYVVQEHHARSMHWDLRLEHDGTLASWAVPRGIPPDPKRNHLAVRTEDHPLEYLDFEGEIPEGSYGAGTMRVWDRGTYELHKFREDEVMITFHGERLQGRYVLFRTDGKNWMIHRMDPPQDADREPMPERLEPMLARTGVLPPEDGRWAYEIKWDGVRAIGYVTGGRLRLASRNGRDITPRYPELRELGRALGSEEAVLDGEVVAFGEDGRPSFQRLQRRMHLTSDSVVRRLARSEPVAYVIFDLLYLDGRSLLGLPYAERRERLLALGLDGPVWQTPAHRVGDGAALLEATRAQGLEGIIAKRLDCPYTPGRRSPYWLKVKNVRRTDVVIGGWLAGEGNRSGRLGALVVGYHDEGGDLRYAGRVGTGFDGRELERLGALLAERARADSPFAGRQPPKQTRFVEPELVCSIEYSEWTQASTLRQPSYKGLRDDVDPAAVRGPGEDEPDVVA